MKDRLVCYILPTFRLGGTEKQVIALSQGVRSRHEIAFLCLNGAEDLATWAQVPQDRVMDARMKGSRDLLVLRRIRSLLKALGPDVVHCFLFDANVWGVLAARWAQVPVILSSRRSVDTWQTKRHILLERLSNLFVDKVTVNSHAVAAFTAAQENLPEEKCRVIYGGVDTHHFRPPLKEPSRTRWFQDHPSFVVGIVGTLMPEKRHDLFLKAARIVADREPGCRFLIVGNGPTRHAVEQLITELSLEHRVFMTGELSDPVPAYASMDLSVLCSDREGFSNAILESMSSGIPVVATDVGGNSEAVVHGQTGFILPPGNSDMLAETILKMIQEKDLRIRMGRAGRQRVIKRFSLDNMIRGHLDLYDQLLGSALDPSRDHQGCRP